MLPLCSDQQSTRGYNGCRLCIAHAWAVVGRRSGRGNHSLHRAYRPNQGARQFQQYAGNPAQRICGGAFPESPLRAIDSLLIFSANGSRAVESFGKSFGCDRISKNTPSNDVAAVLAPALAFTAGCREYRATCALHLIECQSLPPANLLSVALRLARRRGRIGHIPLLPQGFPWSSVWHGEATSSVPGVKVRHGHCCRDCRFRDRPRTNAVAVDSPKCEIHHT